MHFKLKRILFLLLLCLPTFLTFGADIPLLILKNGDGITEIEPSIVLAVAKEEATFDTTNLRPNFPFSEFRPIQEWKGKILKDQTYWGAFQLENRVPNEEGHEEWVLEFSAMNSYLEVYLISADKKIHLSKAGSFIPLKEHTFVPKPGSNVVKLHIPFGQQVTVYFKTKCERKNHLPEFTIELSDLTIFMKNMIIPLILDSVYIGFALMLLLYNLILFFKVKWNSYLFYSAYILGIVVYVGYRSGYLTYFLGFTPLANFPPSIQFFKLSIYFSLVCYIFFSRSFLQLSKHMPWWDRAFKWLALAAIPCMLIESFLVFKDNFSYYPSDWCNMLYAIVFVGFSLCFANKLLKKPEIPSANYIAWGTFFMSFGIIFTAILRYQELSFSLIPFQVTSICEFICFSLGLADARMKNEKEKQTTALELEKNKMKYENQAKEVQYQLELKEAQSRFYGNMTHEFKTPITVIKSLADFEVLDNLEKKIIKKNADKLLDLVQEQLELSKNKSTKLPAEFSSFELVDTLKNWIDDFSSIVKFNKQTVHITSNYPTIHLISDINHLEKIFNNLVGNALKFTQEKGVIAVEVNEEVESVRISIKDNGMGISDNELPLIFDRTYQGNSEAKEKGNGIGLAIVKELTEVIQGKIKVKSESKKGSTFTLILPKTPILEKEPSDSQKTLSQKKIFEKNIRENMNNEPLQNFPIEQETVLIIEDNEDIVYIYKKILGNKYIIDIAGDGVEGYKKAVDLVPDIIICDVMMPKMNGFQVCEKIRANPTTNHIPIIMVSAKTNAIDKRHGMRTGVDYYLTKPFDNEELLIIIQNLQVRKNALLTRFKSIEFEATSKNTTSEVDDIFKIENKFLQDLIQIVEKDLITNKLLAPDIAIELGITLRALRRKLKGITGFTIPQFITNYRVHKAKILLKETDHNVQTIGYEVGFSAPEIFSRKFREIVNQTPNQYRNNS